ncbi:hypothetical protein RN001_005098 [Aquatica leii]|uniref:FHA domain-containing protein n=1 Tax=Aquatica leii TaxID=1421715 RepID=A0AAN7PZQ9_9COLE|nr:hypothetical protein RN001_005098 [Aquatica leii]
MKHKKEKSKRRDESSDTSSSENSVSSNDEKTKDDDGHKKKKYESKRYRKSRSRESLSGSESNPRKSKGDEYKRHKKSNRNDDGGYKHRDEDDDKNRELSRRRERDDNVGENDRHKRYREKEDYHRRYDRSRNFRFNNARNRSRDFDGDNYRRNNSYRRDDRNRGRRDRSRSKSFDHGNARWGKDDEKQNKEKDKVAEREKPNFGLSGKLTEERNSYRGVVIKYSEPPEARKPKRRWRLYPFKGEKALQTLYIHRESAYLIGRDRKVVDLPIDHPSCSKQHAALQYRLVQFTKEDGASGKRVRPYLIDLDSANGTFINNKKIEPRKYVELLEKDVVKFGFSSREYVLLHENSKDEAEDDDVKQEEAEVAVKKEETN